jgi:hypothetical protein
MKSIYAALAAVVLTVPVVASAQQSDTALTRSQVRAELVALEKAGYRPAHGNNPYYPADIQAATARLQPAAQTSGYGGSTAGSSQAGIGADPHGAGHSIYFGR